MQRYFCSTIWFWIIIGEAVFGKKFPSLHVLDGFFWYIHGTALRLIVQWSHFVFDKVGEVKNSKTNISKIIR